MKDSVEVEVERSLPVPARALEDAIANPGDYPRWIEPLNSFTKRADGTYLGDVHYLGRRKQRVMRQLIDEPRRFAWESADSGSYMRWDVSLSPRGAAQTIVRFRWVKHGSGSIFGVSASSPMFRSALEVVTQRSLAALEEFAITRRIGRAP